MNSVAFLTRESDICWWQSEGVIQYSCHFDPLYYDDSLYEELFIERPYFIGSAVVKRRAEFLAGRHCAQRCFRNFSSIPANIGIRESRAPDWPLFVKGSISHCDNMAVSVMAKADYVLGIGTDIEKIVDQSSFNQIVDQVLTNEERVIIDNSSDPLLYFTVAFSMKESFYKAIYSLVERFFDFSVVSILEFSNGKCFFKINENLSQKVREGMIFEGEYMQYGEDNDYIATLAIV